jgi:hypothetical protein
MKRGESRMTIRNMIHGGIAVTTLVALSSGASMANTTLANISVTQTTTSFTLSNGTLATGGTGGTVSPIAVTSTYEGPSFGGLTSGTQTAATTFSFGPLVETSAVSQANFGGQLYDDASFTGSSFSIGGGLLTGTFSGATLGGFDGSTAGNVLSIALDGVTYTGGTYLAAYEGATGATGADGNLSLSLSGINPGLSVNSTTGYFNNFSTPTAGSTGTMDATPAAVRHLGTGIACSPSKHGFFLSPKSLT